MREKRRRCPQRSPQEVDRAAVARVSALRAAHVRAYFSADLRSHARLSRAPASDVIGRASTRKCPFRRGLRRCPLRCTSGNRRSRANQAVVRSDAHDTVQRARRNRGARRRARRKKYSVVRIEEGESVAAQGRKYRAARDQVERRRGAHRSVRCARRTGDRLIVGVETNRAIAFTEIRLIEIAVRRIELRERRRIPERARRCRARPLDDLIQPVRVRLRNIERERVFRDRRIESFSLVFTAGRSIAGSNASLVDARVATQMSMLPKPPLRSDSK